MILFIVIVSFFFALLIIKSRYIYILFLGYSIIYNLPFHQDVLFQISNTKIYRQDIVIASLFWFILYKLFKSHKIYLPKSSKFFALLFLWGIICILRGVLYYSYSAVGEARWYTLLIIYYFSAIIIFQDEQDIKLLIKWFIRFIITLILISFTSYLTYHPTLSIAMFFRIFSSVECLLLAFLSIPLFLFLLFEKKHKILMFIKFFFFFIITFLNQVRSVWIAMVVGLITICITFKHIKMLIYIILFICISQFILINMQSSSKEVMYKSLETYSIFLSDPTKDPTGGWRLIGWQQIIKQTFSGNPILGEGFGNYSDWEYHGERLRVMVHNDYLMYFSKMGIIGLIILFIGLYYFYIEMKKYIRIEINQYSKLLGYSIQICIIMHLVYSFFYPFTMYLWILLGIGTSLARKYSINKDPL